MRVELPETFGGRNSPMIHWRGIALEYYEAGTWAKSSYAQETYRQAWPRGGKYTRFRTGGYPDMGDQIGEPAPANLVRQDVYLEPLESNILFAAAPPTLYQIEVPRGGIPKTTSDDMRVPHGSDTYHYVAWSKLDPLDPELLRQEPAPAPTFGPEYYQLPCHGYDDEGRRIRIEPCPAGDAITERTYALAEQITAPYDNNYDKATAIVDWLQTNLTYTLELAEAPPGQEPVDFFLFDRRKGHCEYFASAFSVLARAAGIPTRNINGFLGGEWNDYYVAVRAGDAHAWNEVYFGNYGWVTFDPTPPRPS
jgi:protein-glutamine gamma-glutamyltransferase